MRQIFMLLLFLPLWCTAQIKLNELHFNHLSINNGLPEDYITALLQDRGGYMWIGTQAGLVRYDGYTAKVYKFGLDDPDHYSISSIYEDRSGELWIGNADEELYRYDRTADSFLHYIHHANYASNKITAFGGIQSIHDDGAGNLWMILSNNEGIGKNVTLFDTKKHQFKTFDVLQKGDQRIYASQVTNSFEDSRGRTWIGTNNGIYEYSPTAGKFIPHLASADSSQQKRFHHLIEDSSHPGVIWMTVLDVQTNKREGLWRYNTNDNTVKAYRRIPNDSTSLGDDAVYEILKDTKGNLWFGTESGLSFLEPSAEKFRNYDIKDKKINPNDHGIILLRVDKAGNFWCYGGSDLLSFNTKTKTFTRHKANEKEPDASPNYITNLLVDRSATLWVGTDFQGVYWLNRDHSKFRVYKNDPGQPHYFPGGGNTSFAEEKDETFWVWSSHGLYHWYPALDSFEFINTKNDQGEDFAYHFSSVVIDRKGLVWCSSFGKGIFNYNPRTKAITNYKKNEKDPTSLIDDYITTFYMDDNGTFWIGTFAGLCRFNHETGKFKQYPYVINYNKTTPDSTLNDPGVYTLYRDKQDELWIGTNLGGVNRLNLNSGMIRSWQNQLPGLTTITSIFEDSKGQLWIGTHVAGLFLYDPQTNKIKKFTEGDGLLYDGVLAINEDDENNLWILSNRGITILNNQTNKISHLGTTTLPGGIEYNSNFFKTSRGAFLMPCNNGFIFFDPKELKPDTILPIIHIESVSITKRQAPGSKQQDSIIYSHGKNQINLRYNENRITFNYVGLQYQNAALNQYAYKLDGYDKDWIQAGTERKTTYTNLSPGRYIFHLKAANSDGVWNPQEQTLTIVISPPWWLTWWAYSLYAVLFFAAIYYFTRWRVRALRREKIILEEKVTQRTHELRNEKETVEKTLTELRSTQSQLIQSEKMASLGELTAGIAHEIQNPLNFVNNFSEVNAELIDELKGERSKVKGKRNEEAENELLNDIKENTEKIIHHGKRADSIVKGMLQHSRTSSGQKELADIKKLADEYLRLAYHGLRAKDKSFNAEIKTEFDNSIGKINIIPQDIGRVLLNLINNAFYAVNERDKMQSASGEYNPQVIVSTKKLGDRIEIIVKDNGRGIPWSVKEKIFQPFFTTKPTGQGTGLGLSLAYDIVKAHGGEIKVQTKEGEGSEFIVQLPMT